jgi:serine/threonine-protein kinase
LTIPAGVKVDRYLIESAIGNGSMGDVLLATDVDLHRKVAVKILSEKHRDNKELQGRFVREGRAVAAISHPNVVQVFSTGRYDDRPFIAMEFLAGTDLQSVVRGRGKMGSEEATRTAAKVARGLQAAANAGLIHRDVKPSNIVLLDSGDIKVTDFGLAKPMDPKKEPALTALGVVVGTPDYIAPEQARGDALDERVDIYALGGTLYYLVTGVPPFRKGNPKDDKYLKVVARHLRDPAPDPRARTPELDAELANTILQMMSKAASDRPSYDELIARLEGISNRLAAGPAGAAYAGKKHPSHATPTPFVGGVHRDEIPSGATAAIDPPNPRQTLMGTPAVERRATTGGTPVPQMPAPSTPAPHTPPPRRPSGPVTGPIPKAHPGAVTMRSEPGTQMSPLYNRPGSEPPAMPNQHPRASSSLAGGAPMTPPPNTPPQGTPIPPDRVGLLRASQALPQQAPATAKKRSSWPLLVLTIVSVAVLAVGITLKVASPGSNANAQTQVADAAPPDGPPPPPDAAPKPLVVPEGMAMVRRADGSPWFFVSNVPVTRGAYSKMFPRQKAGGSGADSAVTRISSKYARAYAEALGGRLPTIEELLAARKAEVIAASGLHEWTAETEGDKPVALSPAGKREQRKDKGYRDLTFRVAKDLPGTGQAPKKTK